MLWAMHMLDPYFGFNSLPPYPGISHRLDYLIRLNVTHCVTSAAYLPRHGRAFDVVSDLLHVPAVCKGIRDAVSKFTQDAHRSSLQHHRGAINHSRTQFTEILVFHEAETAYICRTIGGSI
jgi:hypothetical protein